MIFGLLVIAIVASGVVLLLRSRRQPVRTVGPSTQADPFPKTAAGAALQSYLAAVTDPGADDAEHRARLAFAETAEEGGAALVQTWQATPAEETGFRWALVYAAPVLGRAAVPFLKNVVSSPVAVERSPDPHAHSTRGLDSIVRSRAVDGLERLAVGGDLDAKSALFESLSHELFSVRALAAIALVHLPGGAALKEQVQRALPEGEASVIDIERVPVSVVPQIRDPRKHLASPLMRGLPRPPSPDRRDTGDSSPPQRRRGTRRRHGPPTTAGGRHG